MTSNSKPPKSVKYPCPPENASRTFSADAEIRQHLRRCIEMSIQTCDFGTLYPHIFGPEVTRCLGNARERLTEALASLDAND